MTLSSKAIEQATTPDVIQSKPDLAGGLAASDWARRTGSDAAPEETNSERKNGRTLRPAIVLFNIARVRRSGTLQLFLRNSAPKFDTVIGAGLPGGRPSGSNRGDVSCGSSGFAFSIFTFKSYHAACPVTGSELEYR